MSGTMRALFVAAALFGLAQGAAPAAQQPEGVEELDTVLVSGDHPGPGLWKISSGDHVLWVLGTYGPLPKGMSWRAHNVEARIAESKEVILPATVEVDVGMGFFRTLTLIPAMIKAVYLPDKKTLKDVLPEETWRKWRSAREEHIGRSGTTDRLRPSMAIMILRDKAYERNRLTDGPVVEAIVKSAAKKHRVRVRSLRDVAPRMKIRSDDIRAALTGIRDAADVDCFTRDLDQLDADLEQLRLRANAWATGDIEALRHLHEQPEIGSACDKVFEESVTAGDSATDARMRQLESEYNQLEAEGAERAQREWIAAARKALAKNRSTFALLPIREVVAADGYVAKLAELGYEVEGQ
jgi:hypothetical protein